MGKSRINHQELEGEKRLTLPLGNCMRVNSQIRYSKSETKTCH